jgi:hypothetical protein
MASSCDLAWFGEAVGSAAVADFALEQGLFGLH